MTQPEALDRLDRDCDRYAAAIQQSAVELAELRAENERLRNGADHVARLLELEAGALDADCASEGYDPERDPCPHCFWLKLAGMLRGEEVGT